MSTSANKSQMPHHSIRQSLRLVKSLHRAATHDFILPVPLSARADSGGVNIEYFTNSV